MASSPWVGAWVPPPEVSDLPEHRWSIASPMVSLSATAYSPVVAYFATPLYIYREYPYPQPGDAPDDMLMAPEVT